MMEFSHGENPLDNEVRELADEVREHYPRHPEQAFAHFRNKYPDIVSATMVSIIWSYMEYEQMLRTGLKNTREFTQRDLSLFSSPHYMN